MPLFKFTGKRPKHLGVTNGQLAPLSWKPNGVSSQADDPQKKIAPIAFTTDVASAVEALTTVLTDWPGAAIITRQDRYLHVEFTTPVMGFVDDAEFFFNGKKKVIHVRSAARLGIRDFNVNRKRVEAIRSAFASD